MTGNVHSLTQGHGGNVSWIPRSTGLRYGGDYNPEQWDADTWDDDIRLMRQAGVNLVSLGIFAWALLEPREGHYDFSFLDEIIQRLAAAKIDIDLATPTAAPPAWFWRSYPQAAPVNRDGIRLGYGARGMASPSSPEYRAACVGIASQLAQRYGQHPAVVLWHVHNEYGAPICESYDENSVIAFRTWLRNRYQRLEVLNRAWGTSFWGQQYQCWDDIDAPRTAATTSNPAQRLDFARFSNDALLDCYRAERDAIRHYSDRPITTNFMATNCPSVNYWQWATEVDVIANDHYLVAERADRHILLAMDADLTRSLAGGAPWILMEHSTSAVNWQPRNLPKQPGELIRNSLAHVARGSDAVLFFQFRASRFGAEKFHSAMVGHAGTDSRVWREVVKLGHLLQEHPGIVGTQVHADIAIIWSIESFWAMDLEHRPSIDLDHRQRLEAFYTALWQLGITCDFVHPDADLSGYRMVFAPSLYLITTAQATNLRHYVESGGHLVVSYFSGIVNEYDEVHPGPYPGALREILGLQIHEFLPLAAGQTFRCSDGSTGSIWADDIHLDSAKPVVTAVDGPYPGIAVVTTNTVGDGLAHYVATRFDGPDLSRLVRGWLATANIVATPLPEGLEVVTRSGPQGSYVCYLNHSDTDITWADQHIPAGQVLIHTNGSGPTASAADPEPLTVY